MFDLDKLIRNNIKLLTSYSSPNDDGTADVKVRLNANENAFGSPLTTWYNRYPDPAQAKLKEAISKVKNIATEKIFLGNGSDECIDILYRCFCNPGKDNVIICPPTSERYELFANINDVAVKKAPLLDDFQLDLVHLENLADENTKMIWICSPNDATGNSMDRDDVETVLNNFNGLVVIDEAYINFSRQKSFLQELEDYPNLVVLQTFSKAWGLAGLRLGMAFASPEIVEIMGRVKQPYNISTTTQQLALKALEEVGQVNDMIKELVQMKVALKGVFEKIPFIQKVYPSDANFLLIKVDDAKSLYEFLLQQGIAVKDQSEYELCTNCLRITIGTEEENTELVEALVAWYDFTKGKMN